ncbi:MAG: BBP7 family outer membrane beta-barrel protein [Gemmataceae bacterium]
MYAVVIASLALAQPVAVEEPQPSSTIHFSAEYMAWWLRRAYVPPVLTTSSTASQGVLGQPDTRPLFGDERLETRHNDRFFGTRFALEWMHASRCVGLEGRAFFLERDSTYHTIDHQADPLMALSFVDATTGREASVIVAGQDPKRGLLWGGFVGYSRIELFGQEANAIIPLAEEEGWKLDLLAGARFLQMRDRYHHTATSWELPAKENLSGIIDNYRLHNAFYGAQLGLRSECQWDRFFLQTRATVALGADAQLSRTWGERIYHTPRERTVTPYGLFVQPGNTGTVRNCNFDAVGEVAVNAGYQVCKHLRGYVGYTFLYWADPARAASQVDRVVNQPDPRISFAGDPFWAQGVNVGLELLW